MQLKLKAEVLAQMFDQAKAGKDGAMNKLLEQAEKGELAALNAAVKNRNSEDQPKKAPPVGKKQEQQALAEGVGGKFAPRPAPTIQ